MIVRFALKNIFSFGNRSEIVCFPNNRLQKHRQHVNAKEDIPIDLLRYTALYGANGAGKSNLFKALRLLIDTIKSGSVDIHRYRNLLLNEDEPQELSIEVAPKGEKCTYFYSLQVKKDIVQHEYFATRRFRKDGTPSSAGDIILMERNRVNDTYQYTIPSLKGYANEDAYLSDLFPNAIGESKIAFKYIAEISRREFSEIKKVCEWMETHFIFIAPDIFNLSFPAWLRFDKDFHSFCNQIIPSLDTGVRSIDTKEVKLDDLVVQQFPSHIKEKLKDDTIYSYKVYGENIPHTYFKGNDGQISSLSIISNHVNQNGTAVPFDFQVESDGTIRLLDIITIMYEVVRSDKIYIVDEIESSLHPLLIKETLKILLKQKDVQGQLLFSTHNSLLLSTAMFRRDEIWFVEKKGTQTDLYSLSDYCREHDSIDIEKGYLAGRYGAIPLFGNLNELKWK